MKLSDTEFDAEQREQLGRVLKPDETILWTGSPQGKRVLSRYIGPLLFCLFWVTIPLIIIMESIKANEFDFIMAVPGLFIIIGLFIPFGIQRYHKRQKRRAYVLTDKRAVILAPKLFTGTKVLSYPIKEDMLAEIKRNRDGSGALVFDYSDVVVNGSPLPLGFLDINDVEKPLSLLTQMGVKEGQEAFDL